jgi:hypothetical protein
MDTSQISKHSRPIEDEMQFDMAHMDFLKLMNYIDCLADEGSITNETRMTMQDLVFRFKPIDEKN